VHKGRRKGAAQSGNKVSFGDFALQAVQDGWISDRQIEATRIAISRRIKRGGKVWVRIFPQKSITKKAAETRMGSGKGNPEYWVASVRPGHVLFEMAGVDREIAKDAFKLAGYKLPIKTRFIERE
jgi:large subunit ribosomal protein L16